VNRLLVLLLVVACLFSTLSCGDIFVRGAINTQSTGGLVSIVQFTAASGSGVSITVITLTSNGVARTHTFCGDQRELFPLNHDVRVDFTLGNSCDNVVTVVLG
jgi:hypothetical protein